MKKWLVFLLTVLVLFSFSACVTKIADSTDPDADSTPKVNASKDKDTESTKAPNKSNPDPENSLTGDWSREVDGNTFGLSFSRDGSGTIHTGNDEDVAFTYEDNGSKIVLTNEDNDTETMLYLLSKDGNVLCLYQEDDINDCIALERAGADFSRAGNADFAGDWHSDDGYVLTFSGNRASIAYGGEAELFSYALLPGTQILFYGDNGTDYVYQYNFGNGGDSLEFYSDTLETLSLQRGTAATEPPESKPASDGLTGDWEREVDGTTFGISFSRNGSGTLRSGSDQINFTYTDNGGKVVMTNEDNDTEIMYYLLSEDGNVLCLYQEDDIGDCIAFERAGADFSRAGNADLAGNWGNDDGYALTFSGNRASIAYGQETQGFSYALLSDTQILFYGDDGTDYVYTFSLSRDGNTFTLFDDDDDTLVLTRR